jgi:hypothetical protein
VDEVLHDEGGAGGELGDGLHCGGPPDWKKRAG